ncbi:MAG: MBL fold metallo-hydrolase [Candidatus Delongbacteria bacterium]|nr:MBL fold metallo-hydrolase [Candidatus Delongbacteria bacterium]
MIIKFWGVRGSIPTPLLPVEYENKIREILSLASAVDISDNNKVEAFISDLPSYLKTTYGGNTSCVTISSDQVSIILDAGSGLRLLGSDIENGKYTNITGDEYHMFLSHLHWDHINGLPFFIPLHKNNSKINFYSAHENCEDVLSEQQKQEFFPVSLESRPVDIEFHQLTEENEIKLKDLKIQTKKLGHPNDSYAFKITDSNNKSIVYSTDGEYDHTSKMDTYIAFYKDSEILIFDWQYSPEDIGTKKGFGHSSYKIGIDIAVSSQVKKIALFHHNHDYNDKVIDQNFENAKKYLRDKYPESKLEIILANENSDINI